MQDQKKSKSRKPISERRIVDVLIRHMRQSHITKREVKHYEKRIDVLAMCPDTKELWAIEAKTTDWHRAVAQAIVNLMTNST